MKIRRLNAQIRTAARRGFGFGIGLSAAIVTTAILAVTVTGTVNVFSSGETLTAAKINENFASLKAAIDGIPDHHGVQVGNSSNTVVTHNTPQYLSFDTVAYDNANFYNALTPDRLVIPSTGLYLMHGHVIFQADATGYRLINIKINNGTAVASQIVPGTSGNTVNMSISAQRRLTAGDYVQLEVMQTSGGALTVSSTPTAQNYSSVFTLSQISN